MAGAKKDQALFWLCNQHDDEKQCPTCGGGDGGDVVNVRTPSNPRSLNKVAKWRGVRLRDARH